MAKFQGVVFRRIGMLASDALLRTLSLKSEVFNTVQSICRGKLKMFFDVCGDFVLNARNMHVIIGFFVDVIGLASM